MHDERIDAAWARRAVEAAGMALTDPIVDLYDELVVAISEAAPSWAVERIWARADDLACEIAE